MVKIKENTIQFTADGLKEFLVGSYEEIAAKMEEGTINRTVASTNMNATSSRAHTIVGITFIQKTRNNAGKEMAKSATLNLVDLAGRYEKNTRDCHKKITQPPKKVKRIKNAQF